MSNQFVSMKAAYAILAYAMLIPSVFAEEVVPTESSTLWKCTVPWVCVDEEGGWLDYDEAYATNIDQNVALAEARALCDSAACSEGEKECCYEISGVPPEHCDNYEYCEEISVSMIRRSPKRSGDPEFIVPEFKTTALLYEIWGVGINDGKEFSIDTGKSSEHAARVFRKVGLSHGGVVPGSVQTRVVPFFLHRCYLRVRSKVGDVERNDEVEGVGKSPIEAFDGAAQAAELLMAYLIASDPDAGPRLLPGARFFQAENTRAEVCRQSVLCQYTCNTTSGKHIAVTRHGNTQVNACNIAEAAAMEFADQFGGVTGECLEAGVFPNSLARTACVTCNGGASATMAAEKTDAAKTEAANTPSVLETKSP